MRRVNSRLTSKEFDALREGNTRAIARAISAVEQGGVDARSVIKAIFRYTGRAHIVGITGAPGTGKSTLVNEIAKLYRRRGPRIGIIAVDPSSPFTGGALLGDRLRMQDLSADPGVFIRSMATRGKLGGLAFATAAAIQVLDAAGFETILVETVGAGQSEVEIAKNAHTTVVVEAPGLGDDIQAIKAGVLEIADILVVNKADRDGVHAAVAALETNLNLKPHWANDWRPPVVKTIAIKSEGTEEVLNAIENHREYLRSSDLLQARERTRWRRELEAVLQHQLMAQVAQSANDGRMDALVEKIVAREIDVYAAVEVLLEDVPFRSAKLSGWPG